MLAAITGADLAILDFIYDNLHCAFLDAVMPVITALGNGGILFIAIAVVMLFFKRTRKTGLMIGCALILGLLVCNLTLKPLARKAVPAPCGGIARLPAEGFLVPVRAHDRFV